MSVSPRVRVRQGELVGRKATTPDGTTYYSFQGIPYAKPPIGSLRFRAPEPADGWSEARDATAEGGACAQLPAAGAAFAGSEDCLYLNVYTPSLEGEFLPVLVWIHPGDFQHGSGDADIYGPDLLVEKDVVVVTLNYRLGPLGFLALHTPDAPGNAGLKDQALALEWVRDNIGVFGGSSGNVTVAGAGAGAAAASLLALSSSTKNLLNKLVLQSGTALNEFAIDSHPEENARILANALGCDADDIDEVFSFLQAVSVTDLVETADRLGLTFSPVVEKQFSGAKTFLVENPLDILTSARAASVPILIGSTAFDAAKDLSPIADFALDDDLRVFIPKQLKLNAEEALEVVERLRQAYLDGGHVCSETLPGYLQLASDARVGTDLQRYVDILLQTSDAPIFRYKFSYVGGMNRLKPVLDSFWLKDEGHLDELGYLWLSTELQDVDIAPADLSVRRNMLLLWTNFIKTGNPTPVESELDVNWLPTQLEQGCCLHIGRELVLKTDDDPRLQIWRQLFNKYGKIWDTPASLDQSSDIIEDTEHNKGNDISANARFESTTHSNDEDESGQRDRADSETDQQSPDPHVVRVDPKENIEKTPENGDDDSSESEKAKNRWSTEIKVQQNLSEITVTLNSPQEDTTEAKEVASPAIEITSPQNSPVKQESFLEQETQVQDEPAQVLTLQKQNGKMDEKLKDENIEIGEVPKEESEVSANGQVDSEKNKIKGKSQNVEILVRGEQEVTKKTEEVISEEEKTKGKHFEVKVSNGAGKDIIRANDPPEDDLPKNIGVNKFVSFFESLGGKKN